MNNIDINQLSPLQKLKKFKVSKLIGRSMAPTLKEGDVIFLENVLPQAIKAGDIVVFQGYGKLICHRIVRVNKNSREISFLEKGDNNLTASSIKSEQIIGRVKEIFRGRRQMFTRQDQRAFYNIMSHYFYRCLAPALKLLLNKKLRRACRHMTGRLNYRLNSLLTRP
ncbi:signal peptidase I [Candidatus Saganbacteria bacterium]|nr:signal peptidase I [Candidatus Saganbacteria bacterium]